MPIGDYIHYHAQDYRWYGTTRDTLLQIDTATINYSLARQRLLNQLRLVDRRAQAKILENALNSLRTNGAQEYTGLSKPETDVYMQRAVEQAVPLWGVDFNNFNIMELPNFEEIRRQIANLHRYDLTENSQYILRTNFIGYKQRIVALYNSLQNYISSNNNTNIGRISDIANQLRTLGDEMQSLIDSRARIYHTGTRFYRRIDLQGDNNYARQLLERMNELIGYIKLPEPMALGMAGEYGVAAAIYLLAGRGQDNINEFVDMLFNNYQNTGVVGGNRSRTELTGFSREMFSTEFFIDRTTFHRRDRRGRRRTIPRYRTIDDSNNIYSVRASQDTVDISIDISDSNLANALGMNIINASIKNYSNPQTQRIKVLGGTNILAILMLLDDGRSGFINHYLNMVAQHDPGSHNFLQREMQEKGPGIDFDRNWHDYDWLVRYAAAVRGITGERITNNQNLMLSDFLIVNDQTQERFKVLDSYTILKYLEASANLYQTIIFEGQWPDLHSIENRWVGGTGYSLTKAQARITNLVNMVSRLRITLRFMPNAIYNIQ